MNVCHDDRYMGAQANIIRCRADHLTNIGNLSRQCLFGFCETWSRLDCTNQYGDWPS